MKMTWNLRMLCAEKGIWTAAALGRRMKESLGLVLSPQTLSNLMKKTPQLLSIDMLLALCVALECTPNDLLFVDTRLTRRSSKRLAESIMAGNQRKNKPEVTVRRARKKAPPPKTRI